jgi:hypothetical protein
MHQLATKTRQHARMSVYWPNIDNDIINATKTVKCAPSLPSRRNRSSHVHHPPALLKRSIPISAKLTAAIFWSSSTVSVVGLIWLHFAIKAQRPVKWSNKSESFFQKLVRTH